MQDSHVNKPNVQPTSGYYLYHYTLGQLKNKHQSRQPQRKQMSIVFIGFSGVIHT